MISVAKIERLLSHLVVRAHRSCHVMRVECSVGHPVHKLDGVAVLDHVQRLMNCQILAVWTLHDPPVIHILVAVAGNLREEIPCNAPSNFG